MRDYQKSPKNTKPQPKKHQLSKRTAKTLLLFIATTAIALATTFAALSLYSNTWSLSDLSPAAKYTEPENSTFEIELPPEIAQTTEENPPFPSLAQVYAAQDQHSAANSASSTTNTTSTASSGTNPTAQNWWSYPATIYPCTRSGNDLLVLVNKQYQLPASYVPADLVPTSNSGIRTTKANLYIRNTIVSDLAALDTAAKTAGVDLAVLSAYRSYSTQQSTYNYWLQYNGGDIDATDKVSARPGHSQHQLGTTVDFTTSEISDQLGQHFANTAAGKWVAANAWKYGFIMSFPAGHEATTGFSYEPWHFRYIGKANAAQWHASGQILETWLQGKN